MKPLIKIERVCLIGHIVSMAFGLAGLLLVLPNPDLILNLGDIGQTIFQQSMAGGGVVYIVLGATAVAIYAYRMLGLWHWLTFMLPSVFLSLGSELLGTSTGFPFGHYAYLSGLGYKIAGLVPVTIPMSWFYVGFVSYLIARVGINVDGHKNNWWRQIGAIALGALLLTSWDFVLDPAMSQTAVPFWQWQQPGAFFGMPYQNFAGWMGTGALFMSVAAFFWGKKQLVVKETANTLTRSELILPLVVYLGNFAFAAVMSIGTGLWVPVLLGILLGIVPTVTLWLMASPKQTQVVFETTTALIDTEIPVAQVEVAVK